MTPLEQTYNDGVFPISCFAYTGLGAENGGRPENVQDWVDCGLTVARMGGPGDDDSPERVAEMITMLDTCHERGMKMIVDDHRTTFHAYLEHGEDVYRENVAKIMSQFGEHPAVFGFDIGDEPNTFRIRAALRASEILHTMAPNHSHFLNHGPYSKGGIEWMGRRSYREYLNQFATRGKASFLCHDVYWQMQSHLDHNTPEQPDALQANVYWQPPANDLDSYFNSLKMFSDASKRTGLPWWVTLLACGHWEYRCPSEDDFRWQVSTAAACGAKGLLWYLFYMSGMYQNYRRPPIEHGQRTETFAYLSRVLRTFSNMQGRVLCKLTHERSWHLGKRYGDWPATLDSEHVRDVRAKFPVIVSEFVDREGNPYVMVVNNTTDLTGQAVITWHGKPEVHQIGWDSKEHPAKKYFDDDNPSNPSCMSGAWLAPGQMEFYRLDHTSDEYGVAYDYITD
jgi:hypothetical protein